MQHDLDDLIEEALTNAREDRKHLSSVFSTIEKLISAGDESVMPRLAESIVVVTEGMTKVNSQIIEAAKIVAKSSGKSDEDAFKDDVFSEIEGSRQDGRRES